MAINNLLITAPTQERTWLQEALLVVGASILIALFAPISIPLPFTPIPLATQGHVVLLLAAWLGSKRGTLAVLTYLLQGALGLPVFAGGVAGMLTGPRAGFLLGYVAAAFVTGYLVERLKERSSLRVLGAMGVGNLMIYAVGVPWLAGFVGWQNAFLLGMAPFMVGDPLKLLLASKLYFRAR